jgi:outer membrane protein OmpA-like peptidoglycan-associated protein/tetratricopeptide (TPR) repeat protein
MFSQEATSEYTTNKKAIDFFNKAIYNVADPKLKATNAHIKTAKMNLEKAIALDKNYLEAYYMLAELYEIEQNKEDAVKNYLKVYAIDPNYDTFVCFKIASLSYRIAAYNQAKEFIDLFYQNADTSQYKKINFGRIKDFIDFAYEAFNNPVNFNPINLGPSVNSIYDEYWPSLSIDDNTLVFTRLIPAMVNPTNRPEDNFQEDLFVAEREEKTGVFGKAYPMRSIINTALNEGAQCISGDGKTCIVTCCNRPTGKGSCDLYIMFNRNGRWSEPENMKTINTQHWESNPSLSADGRLLYFASKRPDGYGGIDIWKVKLDERGNAVGKIENLGPVINTDKDDASPFIHPDGRTLYFASEGHPGMGDLDIFYSKLNPDNTWQKPVNMGYPINTAGEERSMIVNAKGELAIFASPGTLNGRKDLDLFGFEIPAESRPTVVTYVKGFVYNVKNNSRIDNALCELIDLETNEKVMTQFSDTQTGEFLIALPVEHDYAFNVTKTGFLFYSANFSLKSIKDPSKPYLMNIPLSPIEEGSIVILKNIFFDHDSYDLLPESFVELTKLLEYLTNNPTLNIEIGGHTDSHGSKEHNKILSQNRAKSVYNYLITNGINEKRLTYAGYYFSTPIATNDTEEGRALNRRTEFKIISVK